MNCVTGEMSVVDHGRAEGMAQVGAAELAERVMQIAHRIRRAASAGLAPLQITPAQSRALRVISRADGPIRMGEVAAALDVVPRSATGLVEALETAGLVERTVDPANRRSVLVSLSERGHGSLRDMAEARASTAAEIFGVLRSDERVLLADILAKVQESGATAPGSTKASTLDHPAKP